MASPAMKQKERASEFAQAPLAELPPSQLSGITLSRVKQGELILTKNDPMFTPALAFIQSTCKAFDKKDVV